VLHIWKVEHTKNHTICNTSPKWKEVNLFLLTGTMHSAKDKHFRSFFIGVPLLYDSKGKFKSCRHDLNMLRVELTTSKDASLSRISPSEPSFKQHVLRPQLFCVLHLWKVEHTKNQKICNASPKWKEVFGNCS
jgi:hypothetical protein